MRYQARWVLLGLFLAFSGCSAKFPDGAIVLTQIPVGSENSTQALDSLDLRYPAGSRVALVISPDKQNQPETVRVLSRGLSAAGDPIVSPDGNRVFFAGKAQPAGAWQIYETKTGGGGRPRAVTSVEGGAMDPAIVSTGELVFSSPVPRAGETWTAKQPSALFARSSGGEVRRLTFGARAAVEPTVLRDGRILFVSSRAETSPPADPEPGLFTVNKDGTEVTAFALDHNGAPLIHRPRELLDGRIGFLAMTSHERDYESSAEGIHASRPFLSRTNLFSFRTGPCRSVEPDGEGALLACFETGRQPARSTNSSFGVYRVARNAAELGEPIFDDPAWHDVEATPATARPKPMGHLSAIVPAKTTGTILCLNANFTRRLSRNGPVSSQAQRVRVLVATDRGEACALGEVPLQADGSFMVEVPADVPLGFEALDGNGRVLRRLPPSIWVRPGENRSCLGCHEPPNRSSSNVRPLAASRPPVVLTGKNQALTQKTH